MIEDPALEALKAADAIAWDQIRLLSGALIAAQEVANKTSLAIVEYRRARAA